MIGKTVELAGLRKDGREFLIELSISTWRTEGEIFFTAIIRDITDRKRTEEELKQYQNHLEDLVRERTKELENKNVALSEILSQIELEKKHLKEQVTTNIERVVTPTLKRLRQNAEGLTKKYVDLLEKNLDDLTSSFGAQLSKKMYRLTPKEIEICTMIRSGMSSKDIASHLHVSFSTIENQRNTIRKKLDISRQDVNLTTFLQQL